MRYFRLNSMIEVENLDIDMFDGMFILLLISWFIVRIIRVSTINESSIYLGYKVLTYMIITHTVNT